MGYKSDLVSGGLNATRVLLELLRNATSPFPILQAVVDVVLGIFQCAQVRPVGIVWLSYIDVRSRYTPRTSNATGGGR